MLREQASDERLIGVRSSTERVVAVPLAIDVAEIAHESRPARESILAGDDELGVGEADPRRRRYIDCGMARAGPRECIGFAGAQLAEERFGLFALELEVGHWRQRAQCGHETPFRTGPVSAWWARKEGDKSSR
jgi:hypothetical protein